MALNAAIEKALLDKAILFAETQSPALDIALQNGVGADGRHFKKPTIRTKNEQYLRATVLHAPALATGIAYDAHVQHYGLLQIDVIQANGGGTQAMVRTISAIIDYFQMGTEMTEGDAVVRVLPHSLRVVTQGPLMKDDDAWVKIPVSIPWLCFERPA